MIVEIPN